jgi:hypothetical protein
MSEEHVHEENPEEILSVEPPPPRPMIDYEATYQDRKGRTVVIEDIRGFQFDSGFYFLYVVVEGMPVPQVRVLDLSSPDVRNMQVMPVRLIEPND